MNTGNAHQRRSARPSVEIQFSIALFSDDGGSALHAA
jgi:hypothetical protein